MYVAKFNVINDFLSSDLDSSPSILPEHSECTQVCVVPMINSTHSYIKRCISSEWHGASVTCDGEYTSISVYNLNNVLY